VLTIYKFNNGLRGLFEGSLPESGVGTEVFGVVKLVELVKGNAANLRCYRPGTFPRERGCGFSGD